MVESVDKRDETERPDPGAAVTPRGLAATPQAGDRYAQPDPDDAADLPVAPLAAQEPPADPASPDDAARNLPAEEARASVPPAADETLEPLHARIPTLAAAAHVEAPQETLAHPPVPAWEAPAPVAEASVPLLETTASFEAAGARIIPFVPRGGVVRPMMSAMQPEPPFARVSFAAAAAVAAPAAIPPLALPPAQPPPPSGFRRSPGWRPEAPAPANARPAEAKTASTPGGTSRDFARRVKRSVRWTALACAALALAYALTIVVLAVAYRWVNPPTSTLMLGQSITGTEISQRWVPLDRISPNLVHAVILSEDGQFCRHHGVDWLAMREAIEQSLDGAVRGGSTITMQTVKNLFLWPSKSYLRKAIEIPLALGTEVVWPKERILELYLNIAEWGPGVFGAEAAARYHFGKSAANLTHREASLLAVSLPNPFEREAGNPGPGTQRLADRLQIRMRRVPRASACVVSTGVPPRRLGVADSGALR